LKEEGGGGSCGGGRGWLLGSTAKGTVLGGGAGEEIEDGSMRRERERERERETERERG